MTDVELDARVTALEENGGGDGVNGKKYILYIGGSNGGPQGRPPWGSKFFHFYPVFGNKIEK